MSSNSTDSFTFGDEYVCSKNENKYLVEINEFNRLSNNEKFKLKRIFEEDSESFKEGRIVDSGVENSERDDDEKCEIIRSERTKSMMEELEKYTCEGDQLIRILEIPKFQLDTKDTSLLDDASEFMFSKTDQFDKEDLEEFDINEFRNIAYTEDYDSLVFNDINRFKENGTEANYDMSLNALSKRKQKQSKKKTQAELKPCSKQEGDSKEKGRQVANIATNEIAKDCYQELNYLRENSTCDINHNGLSMTEKEQMDCSKSVPLSEVKPKMSSKADIASASIIRSQVVEMKIDDQSECNYETTDSFDKSKEQEVKEGGESCDKKEIPDLSDTMELNNMNLFH